MSFVVVCRISPRFSLFADADGATKFSEFKSVEEALLEKTNDINKDKVVVIGSR